MTRRLATLIVGTVLLAGFWVLWWRTAEPMGQEDHLPPVVRGLDQTTRMVTAAALRFNIMEMEMGDAWLEPECQGGAVFLLTEQGPMWAWYDLRRDDVTEKLTLVDVLAAVQQQVAVQPHALAWRPRPDGPGMRLRFPVGLTEAGEQVLLRLRTEECSILSGVLEQTPDPSQPGSRRVVSFAPQPRQVYTNEWKTDARVHRLTLDESGPILDNLKNHLEITGGYGADMWIEEACHMVAAHIMPDGTRTTEYWVLWDQATNQPVETLDKAQVLDILSRGAPGLYFMEEQWGFWQDAPGRRTRYVAGLHNFDAIYVHFNTRNCSLQPITLQIAKDQEDMGRFVTLPVLEPAPAGSS